MKELTKNVNIDQDAAGLFLPYRDSSGRPVSDSVNPDVQNYIFCTTRLKNVHDKIGKLRQEGKTSKEKKTLIRIATDNLEQYFNKGGKPGDYIEVNVNDPQDGKNETKKVTAAQLQNDFLSTALETYYLPILAQLLDQKEQIQRQENLLKEQKKDSEKAPQDLKQEKQDLKTKKDSFKQEMRAVVTTVVASRNALPKGKNSPYLSLIANCNSLLKQVRTK